MANSNRSSGLRADLNGVGGIKLYFTMPPATAKVIISFVDKRVTVRAHLEAPPTRSAAVRARPVARRPRQSFSGPFGEMLDSVPTVDAVPQNTHSLE